ncbi:MAG TPA: VWA domain-containing protein [Verrucomicrobiota bacterium]|nr:VWA domain-containing protein [Verrucomicrobiota bacterium]
MTELLHSFHFLRPGWLLLVPLVVGVWWLWRRRCDPLRGWRAQMAPELLPALVVGRESSRAQPAHWALGAFLLACVASAGPAWRLEPDPLADDAAPLMILLKADASMEQPGPAPSRIERARLKIADLAEAWKGRALGLIAYAGTAHLVLPPTRDTALAVGMAAAIGPEVMPEPGDRLDLALREANRALRDGQRGGSVVVLADAVGTDLAALRAVEEETPFEVQFLAISDRDASQDDSLRSAARVLKAALVPISIEDQDVATIARRAARQVGALSEGRGGRWQEAGYWLVPLVGAGVLTSLCLERRHALDPGKAAGIGSA